jgi:hypothetical protein
MAKPTTKAKSAAKRVEKPLEKPVEKEATSSDATHAAAVVQLRATTADVSAAAALPDAPKTSARPIARKETDLIVGHAAAIGAMAVAIESAQEIDVTAGIATAKALQVKLDLLERLQGSYEAARADVAATTGEVAAFAAIVAGVAGSASPKSKIGKALGAFRKAHAAVINSTGRVTAYRETVQARKSSPKSKT